MKLSYRQLKNLVPDVIDCPMEQVGDSSIDLRINIDDCWIQKDEFNTGWDKVEWTTEKRKVMGGGEVECYVLVNEPYKHKFESIVIHQGQFILSSTIEKVNLPLDLMATLSLRSSVARAGLNHCLAGHIDVGFTGNITLELYNAGKWPIVINRNDRICQLTFDKVEPVSHEFSYKAKGRYQDSNGTVLSKGI